MKKYIQISIQDGSEFERLLKAYQEARDDLRAYLFREDLTAKEEVASGN